MQKLNILIGIITLLLSTAVFGQSNSALQNFEVFEVDGKVQISATIKAGYSCLGMNFLRTEDTTVIFQSIGSIPGVCGSTNESLRYDFTDENPPKNKNVYYKVQLGGIGYSEILTIRVIDTGKAAYLVSPNPAGSHCYIYFKNESQNIHRLTLLNRVGYSVLNAESSGNSFFLNLENIPHGVYYFSVAEENKSRPSFYGKLSIY